MAVLPLGSQPDVFVSFNRQKGLQPQEQQARDLRSERERVDSTRLNDQVTLSGASRQVAASKTGQVVPQNDVTATTDKSKAQDFVKQAQKTAVATQRNEKPVPSSVARALETYTQAAALNG